MCTGTTTVTRLPGLPDQLEDHDHCPFGEQGAKDPKGVSSHAQSAEGYSSTTRSSNWVNDSMPTSYCSSSATLPYRALQDLRSTALQPPRIDYDTLVYLSEEAKVDLNWYFTSHMCRPIQPPIASLTLQTDASTIGWGAYCQETDQRTGGPWSGPEAAHHINWLELKAAFLVVQSFVKQESCHIQLLMDSRVAISSYTNQKGRTHSHRLCQLALDPVDVVRGSQHNFARGASTREIEYHCGFRVQTHERQQRLATGHRDFLSSSTNSRSFLSGSIRVLPECSTGSFLQLDGRPPSSCNICFCSGLVGSQTILFPSLCTHREMSTEGQKQQCSICSLDCTNLPGSSMVSTASEHVGQPSIH